MDESEEKTPIDPSDATAGAPDGERKGMPSFEAGPDAVPEENADSNEYDK